MTILSSPHILVFQSDGDTAAPPLVLLHGSDGTEADLLPLAGRLAPGASTLALRGTVATDGGYAFFRRHPDRRVDEDDLRSRIPALAARLEEFTERGRFAEPPIAVGFSNGATMAAALVSTHPELLTGAVLLRPLTPFSDPASYRPTTLPVLIVDGAQDHRRSPDDGLRLAAQLSHAGARVTHHVLPGGHAITGQDEQIAAARLEALKPGADASAAAS